MFELVCLVASGCAGGVDVDPHATVMDFVSGLPSTAVTPSRSLSSFLLETLCCYCPFLGIDSELFELQSV